jgi:hypothetical protein
MSAAANTATVAARRSSVGVRQRRQHGQRDCSYRVAYQFTGFLQPINDTAHTGLLESTFKLGSTVPAKFQLKDANGNVVQAGSAPQFTRSARQGDCDPNTTTEAIDSDPGFLSSDYRWDATARTVHLQLEHRA